MRMKVKEECRRRMCPPNVGSESSPVDVADPGTASSLTLDKDDPSNMAMQSGMAPGTYMLCVTVDNAGALSNGAPIPSGEYMATAYALSGAPGTRATDAIEVASGKIGEIKRNGASSQVAFLTTAEKYNQRLIVVNHNQSRAIAITDIQVNVQDDVEGFEVMGDPAELVIGPGEMKVYLVADVLEIMGRNRASGTLSFNGVAGDISVATTIVNREDGSTDTVMWPVN